MSSIYLIFEYLSRVLKALATKDTIFQSWLLILLRSLSAKRVFANLRPWGNSACYSYFAGPAYETISYRWCLSLIFHILHVSIHTQKTHSCSYCTRKTGKCFQTEDLSAACIKWSRPVWHLLTSLGYCEIQTSSALKPLSVYSWVL